MFEIPYYHDYLSPKLAQHLWSAGVEIEGIPGLRVNGAIGGLENPESLKFLVNLYSKIRVPLGKVLAQRFADRKFIDDRVQACAEFNAEYHRSITDPDYQTVLGLEDADGRIVFGALGSHYCKAGGEKVAELPDFLKGPHVTLFGPPDSAKMAINAMNAYHRKRNDEPAIVQELLDSSSLRPMWGADSEDSKTPLRNDLLDTGVNLSACFDFSIEHKENGKDYGLAKDHLSFPIKRFPGLALPCSFLFYHGNPIPLHLYDFALHVFKNWQNSAALVFYVPKLENEEEAAYIATLMRETEEVLVALHPEYKKGSLRLMIVLENPRAILRTHEIINALHPYFVGASLGWHDYLASTARLFKNDPQYRIPVKADPNIVVKYIQASHLLLADVVGSRGGIKVGGMYGILPSAGADSWQVTLRGFFKDVVTQLKRDLNGYWVAHPDFVRIGLALVIAWQKKLEGNAAPLTTLVQALLEPKYQIEILKLIDGADVEALNPNDPHYVRSLIVADIKESDYIANNHPDEIRYNVFQTLQYLADWLTGNGCVALPTAIDGIPVRVMDDLATTERSRWEVWHEIHHQRFSVEEFIKIAHEEMNFIRRDLSNEKKVVQVKWDERTSRWYPIAFKLMLQLMTEQKPVEFATEYLIPFTVEEIRNAADPWAAVQKYCAKKFQCEKYVADFHHYFEICGSQVFAKTMASQIIFDAALAEKTILNLNDQELLAAASFHGDIGQTKATLDPVATQEQAKVFSEDESLRQELQTLGTEYRNKFGIKFLISAKGKTGAELLAQLKSRMTNDRNQEWKTARKELWEISRKRLSESEPPNLLKLLEVQNVSGASIAINYRKETQIVSLGKRNRNDAVEMNTLFPIASLSKCLAAVIALEYFAQKGLSLDQPINLLFARTKSNFRLSGKNPAWAESATLRHLLSHTALNMHYVNGIADGIPAAQDLLAGAKNYQPVEVLQEPGRVFQYSGGGFIVLEHLLEAMEERPVEEVVRPLFQKLGLEVHWQTPAKNAATGFFDNGTEVPRMDFPKFAAGAWTTSQDYAKFLQVLTSSFQSLHSESISHDTAVEMLKGTDKGCRAFMGCDMGLGIFTLEGGANRFCLHQGANEGFRALFLHCYAGPDQGKGFVIFANGDNKAVIAIAQLALVLLQKLEFQGIDLNNLEKDFQFDNLPQEQIVNLGYKKLLFERFLPDLPEEISVHGPRDPLSDYNQLLDAEILETSNQKFARAKNLISPYEPCFDSTLFGCQGKIMDSWETVRHNEAEFDFLTLRLKKASVVEYVSISTKYHDGNQASFIAIDFLEKSEWQPLLGKTPLLGHALLQLRLPQKSTTFDQIRVKMYPDGGISRLALFSDLPSHLQSQFLLPAAAQSVRFSEAIPKTKKPLSMPYAASKADMERNRSRVPKAEQNLASMAFGASVVRASNEHYGPAIQVISPFPPLHMFDGLESARSRTPGHSEFVVISLHERETISELQLDFQFFVNNNPLYVSIEYEDKGEWKSLVEKSKVKAFAGNTKAFRFAPVSCEKIKVTTYPDGGINRIRVYANPAALAKLQ